MKQVDFRVLLALALCAFGWTACEVEFTGDEDEGEIAQEAQAVEETVAEDVAEAEVDPDRPTGVVSGFLWKPTSESNGRLVILLPSAYNGGRVSSCEIHTRLPPSTGSLVEAGGYAGDHNGDRPHYRFSRPGSGYGNNIHVVARFPDNSIETWLVPDGSERTTY